MMGPKTKWRFYEKYYSAPYLYAVPETLIQGRQLDSKMTPIPAVVPFSSKSWSLYPGNRTDEKVSTACSTSSGKEWHIFPSDFFACRPSIP
jgi:hypothetical protein